MGCVRMILNACTEIMRCKIDLFGYSVSIMQAVVFAFLGSMLFMLVKKAI